MRLLSPLPAYQGSKRFLPLRLPRHGYADCRRSPEAEGLDLDLRQPSELPIVVEERDGQKQEVVPVQHFAVDGSPPRVDIQIRRLLLLGQVLPGDRQIAHHSPGSRFRRAQVILHHQSQQVLRLLHQVAVQPPKGRRVCQVWQTTIHFQQEGRPDLR